jgi:hypothetical protein
MTHPLELLLSDTVPMLLALNRSIGVNGEGQGLFDLGRRQGLHEAIGLLHSQVLAFGVSPESCGFPKGFEPDRDLVA